MAVPLKCVLLASLVLNVATFELHGTRVDRAEPLTHHKTIHCFDENVKIRDPKNFEVEKRNKNEETKMLIIRNKRESGCIVKTKISESDDMILPDPRNFRTKSSYDVSMEVTSPPEEHSYNSHHSHAMTSPPVSRTYSDHSSGHHSRSDNPPPVHHTYSDHHSSHHSHSATIPPVHHSYHHSHTVTSPPVRRIYHHSRTVTSPPVHRSYHHSRTVTSPPIVRTYSSHTSHSVTSRPVVRVYSTSSTHTHSHDEELDSNDPPGIPHLPHIPHIGHEGIYIDHDDSDDRDEPSDGYGENTNTRYKGRYPTRIGDDWRNKFRDIADIRNSSPSSHRDCYRLFWAVLLQCALLALLT